MERRTVRDKVLVVPGSDLSGYEPLGEALAGVGMTTQRVLRRAEGPEEVLLRADVEGGVPIVVCWDAGGDGVRTVVDLLARDPMPGRTYVLVAPTDVVAALASERLEALVPCSMERVLVLGASDLALASSRLLLALHLARTTRTRLSVAPRCGVHPSPVTGPPHADRPIGHIDRRAAQRGRFHIAAPRVPTF